MDNDSRLRKIVRQAYYAYLQLDAKQRADYRVPHGMLTGDTVPATYFARRLCRNVHLARDIRGAKQALVDTLADLIKLGFFECVSTSEAIGRYGSKVSLYRPGVTNEMLSWI